MFNFFSKKEMPLYLSVGMSVINILYCVAGHPINFLVNLKYLMNIIFSFHFLNCLFGLIVLNSLILAATMAFLVSDADWFESEMILSPFLNGCHIINHIKIKN